MRSENQTQKRLQAEVDAFNSKVSIGSAVDYFEVQGDPLQRFNTRTEAQILSGHTAVVWLQGKSGCVCVSHCIPVEALTASGAVVQ
jgi:hypothetical protein